MNKLLLILVLQFGITTLTAQNYKFGKVSIEELKEKSCVIDSTAEAEVLYYKERIKYTYVGSGRFYKLKKIHKRIKIHSKKGYDWASHSVYLWGKHTKGGISDIKGATYNLKEGQIVTSKLKKDNIFKEEVNKNVQKVTLTMPDVKEGCIIEFKYMLHVGASGLDDILLQDFIPIRKIDYQAKVPDYLKLKAYPNYHSLLKPKLIKSTDRQVSGGRYSFKENVFIIKEENVPALKEETHVSNLRKHMSKISFELYSVNSNNLLANWDKIVKDVYENPNFGGQLKINKYFKEDLDKLSFPSGKVDDKLKIIFNYLKSKVKWNNILGYYSYNGVKKAYKNGEGNVADINLMLVAMLRYVGINANPILVSTKSNGVPLFPTREGFNYVICGVEKKEEVVMLDASQQFASINNLPEKALNWQGRIIRKHGSSTWVNLYHKKNSVETNMLSVDVNNDLEFEGRFRSRKSNYFAYNYRKKYAGVSKEILLEKLRENIGVDITDFDVTDLENVYKPVGVEYRFKTDEGIEEIGGDLYLDPLIFLTVEENVFNQEQRNYPIDFEYPVTYKTIVNLKIPEGYKIKSYPKSEKIVMIEDIGEYSYMVKANVNSIQISQVLKVNIPVVPASYYKGLREMYKVMINKNSEKIILEKIEFNSKKDKSKFVLTKQS